MTLTQAELHERFRALHEGPGFVMPNAWDGLSARIFASAGFAATATSSAALAFSLGRRDGRHQVSRDEHLAHARLLVEAGGLPVNGDFEDGYGDTPADVAATVRGAIEAGMAGIGIEDTSGDPDAPIRDFDDAVARIAAAAGAARGRIVLTGRTDVYLHSHDLDEALRRLTAFAEAGADALYLPGVTDLDTVRVVASAVSPTPLNVRIGPGETTDDLFAAGARRISIGSLLYLKALGSVRDTARQIAAGHLGAATGGMSYGDATAFVAD